MKMWLIALVTYEVIGIICLLIAIGNTYGRKIHEFIWYQPRGSFVLYGFGLSGLFFMVLRYVF